MHVWGMKTFFEILKIYRENSNITFEDIIDFHYKFEKIHPFQDGNGRVGRLIMFKECLKYQISPFIIEDKNRPGYLEALKEYRQTKTVVGLVALFKKEQEYYYNQCQYFLSE